MIKVSISTGELLDRMSILEIKSHRLPRPEQRLNASRELQTLRAHRTEDVFEQQIHRLFVELCQVNRTLWDIEEAIRTCEHRKQFDSDFVQLARSVYLNNDIRAAIKRKIDEITDSPIREEKSHQDYWGE